MNESRVKSHDRGGSIAVRNLRSFSSRRVKVILGGSRTEPILLSSDLSLSVRTFLNQTRCQVISCFELSHGPRLHWAETKLRYDGKAPEGRRNIGLWPNARLLRGLRWSGTGCGSLSWSCQRFIAAPYFTFPDTTCPDRPSSSSL